VRLRVGEGEEEGIEEEETNEDEVFIDKVIFAFVFN